MKKSLWTDPFGTKGQREPEDDPEREDPLNPAFPKAPLVPRDFAKMINAALPKWSKPPGPQPGDARAYSGQVGGSSESPRQHVDAHPPPGATPSTYESAAMPPHSDPIEHEPRSGPAPAMHSTAAPAARSRRQGSAARISRSVPAEGRWRRARGPLAMVIALLAAVLAGMWLASMMH